MLKLCLVTEPKHASLDAYLNFLEQAILGGVTAIQIRDKHHSFATVYQSALAIKALLSSYSIPLIINDSIELAQRIDADGIHLGQSDMPPLDARKLLGKDKIIGLSIETLEQLDVANTLDCIDYVAASAIFKSKTKLDCKTLWGLDGLKQFSQASKHPVIAIGGITKDNVRQVVQHGASGIAVVSAIHDHPNPKLAAENFIQEINQGIHYV